MYKLGLEKSEEPELKLSTFAVSQRKQENSIKTSTFASLTTLKPLTMWITTNCGKFLKRWKYQTTSSTWVKKQQLEPDMEKLTSSKLGKEYKTVYCHSAYLTYMWSKYIMQNARLDEAQDGIKIAERNVSNIRYADNTALMTGSEEEQESLFMWVKKESEKSGLQLNIQKLRSGHPVLFSSVQLSYSVVSNSLRPHEPQHARPPCPSPPPGVHPTSCPLSW